MSHTYRLRREISLKEYDAGSYKLNFHVIGELGAVTLYSWYFRGAKRISPVMIGFHFRKPQFSDHNPSDIYCEALRGQDCYYYDLHVENSLLFRDMPPKLRKEEILSELEVWYKKAFIYLEVA